MKKHQLPKEFAAKWVEALRTTKLEQTSGFMRMDDCYCANGIGAIANGFDLREDDNIYVDDRNRNWDPFYDLIGKKLFEDIYHLNDLEGKPFPEIADWIETNVEFI